MFRSSLRCYRTEGKAHRESHREKESVKSRGINTHRYTHMHMQIERLEERQEIEKWRE